MDMREEAVQKALANHELAEKAGTMDSEDGEKAEAKADTAPAYSRTARCIGFILLVPLSSLVCLLAVNLNIPGKWFEPVMVLLMFLALTGFYLLFRKKLIPAVAITNGVLAGALILLITVLMVIAKGSTEGSIMMTTSRLFALILPGYFIIRLWLDVVLSLIVVVGMNIFAFLLSVVLQKRFDLLKKAIPYFAAGVICIGACAVLYANRPAARYSGHGFEFMHGWSSTDFSDYMVWSNPSKLASLDHPAGLIIEDEKDMLLDSEAGRILGDIYISLDKCIEQAKEYGHSFLRELAFLSVHGFLHLQGYDHMKKEDEEVMFKLQDEILDSYGIKRG